MRGISSGFAATVRQAWRGRQPATGLQKRGFAAAPGEEPKVNMWEAPTQIAKWKEEHIVFVVLAGWVVGISGAMKVFGGKKEEQPASS